MRLYYLISTPEGLHVEVRSRRNTSRKRVSMVGSSLPVDHYLRYRGSDSQLAALTILADNHARGCRFARNDHWDLRASVALKKHLRFHDEVLQPLPEVGFYLYITSAEIAAWLNSGERPSRNDSAGVPRCIASDSTKSSWRFTDERFRSQRPVCIGG